VFDCEPDALIQGSSNAEVLAVVDDRNALSALKFFELSDGVGIRTVVNDNYATDLIPNRVNTFVNQPSSPVRDDYGARRIFGACHQLTRQGYFFHRLRRLAMERLPMAEIVEQTGGPGRAALPGTASTFGHASGGVFVMSLSTGQCGAFVRTLGTLEFQW
jgi:hypothetical protein